jgi:hypothetical protein
MNLVVARHAEELVSRNVMGILVAEKSAPCLRPSVLLVVRKQLCRLSPLGTDLYIAEIASKPDVARIKPILADLKGLVILTPFIIPFFKGLSGG